jgi:hypothetical protein
MRFGRSIDGGEACDWVTMGRDQAQPQAERWKRDRELVNPQLRSCHSLRSGIRRERGLERGAGSGEHCFGLGPTSQPAGLVDLCPRSAPHQRTKDRNEERNL